jgi:hypothetical protein
VMKLLITAVLAGCLATPACALTPEQQNVQDGYVLAMAAAELCPDLKLDDDGADIYLAKGIVMFSISYPDWHAALQKTISDLAPIMREKHRQAPAAFCEVAWNIYGPTGLKMLQKK